MLASNTGAELSTRDCQDGSTRTVSHVADLIGYVEDIEGKASAGLSYHVFMSQTEWCAITRWHRGAGSKPVKAPNRSMVDFRTRQPRLVGSEWLTEARSDQKLKQHNSAPYVMDSPNRLRCLHDRCRGIIHFTCALQKKIVGPKERHQTGVYAAASSPAPGRH